MNSSRTSWESAHLSIARLTNSPPLSTVIVAGAPRRATSGVNAAAERKTGVCISEEREIFLICEHTHASKSDPELGPLVARNFPREFPNVLHHCARDSQAKSGSYVTI